MATPNNILAAPAPSRWRLYYALTKPRVVALIVLTAVVGSLLAVNGMPLTYHDPDSGVDVVRGTFTIHTTSRYDFAETDSSASGISTLSSSGQWTISNNTLTLLGDDHTLYLGTLSGHHDTLTTLIGAHVGTYVRQ